MALTRMNTVFHVDLSDADPDEEYWIPSGKGLRNTLAPHTNETHDRLFRAAPHLESRSGIKLTHFTAQPLQVSAEGVMRMQVRHTLRTQPQAKGAWGVTHSGLHIPPKPALLRKLQSEGSSHEMPLDYLTSAKLLVFHHPELISIDTKVAEAVYGYLDNDPNIGALLDKVVKMMRQLGPPKEDKGWARLVPITPDANPNLNIDGKTSYYMQEPSDKIIEVLGPVMTAVLIAAHNDLSLKNIKWRVTEGTAVQQHDGPTLLASARNLRGEKWDVAVANTKEVHGLSVQAKVEDSNQKKVKLTFENTFIRYLGAYIRFFDANDKEIKVPEWKAEDADIVTRLINEVINPQYDTLRFIGQVGPVNSFFAIPIMGDPGRLEVTIKMPDNAVRAEVFGSGMGHGDNQWPKTPLVGGIYTGVFNLGVPSFMLAFGVAKQSYKKLYDIINEISGNKAVIGVVGTLAVAYYGNAFAGEAIAHSRLNWKALTSLASTIFNIVFGKVLEEIEKDLAEGVVTDQIPFAGWLIVAMNIATGVAQLAQTIVAVATSPWNIPNVVSTSITTNVVLSPDPRHKDAFPRGQKRSYVVKMFRRGRTDPTYSQSHPVADNFDAATLPAAFPDNALGGQVRFEAEFFIGNWLAAKATTPWIDNDDVHASTVKMVLVEFPKPLSEKSVYAHNAILSFDKGAYVWAPSTTAPTATKASTNADANGNAISDWVGITLNQRLGRLGFAWRAAGMGVKECVTGQSGQLFAMQSVDLPGAKMNDVKFPPCAFGGPTQLIYDPFPPKFKMKDDGQWALDANGRPIPADDDERLRNFYVDPRKANVSLEEGGGFHLREVTSLDGNTPFDVTPKLSWGRFPFFPDSFALHPAGHLIAVSTKIGKIQIATLPQRASKDNEMPVARAYAGEAHNRDRRGLLFNPIAVGCAYDGTILVLEDAKYSTGSEDVIVSRIQAFDLFGNPVNRFNNGTSPFLEIAEEKSIRYLDLAVVGTEKQTYIYVLYFRGTGESAADYHMTIYQYGSDGAKLKNPLVTTDKVAAARLTVDMWHTMYTLNYDMVRDASGKVAGPAGEGTGPGGRTVPSVSEWLPPTE
jgi:hypothetical protein